MAKSYSIEEFSQLYGQQPTAIPQVNSGVPFVPQQAQPQGGYKPSFPARVGQDSGLTAGFKAIGNTPGSAFNFGKSIVDAVRNPIQTVKGIGSIAAGGVQKLIPGEQAQEGNFEAFTGMLKERYGSLDALQKTATEDPFAFGADLVGLLQGGAALAGKTGQLNNVLSKVAKPVTTPIKAVGKVAASTPKFAVSQVTGLSGDTISTVANNPAADFANVNRTGVANEVFDTITKKIDDVSELGAEYKPIREARTPVSLKEDVVSKILSNEGIGVKNGKLVVTADSTPLSTGDIAALENFIKTYSNPTNSNAFLNARKAAGQIADFDGATDDLSRIGKKIYAELNKAGRGQIKGLEDLDTKFSPEVEMLKSIKKDYLNKDGTFKDGAINKIANATGKGKDQLLERLEELKPGISQKIKVLKAAEDIEISAGQKVGAYAAGAFRGGVAGLLAGDPLIGAVVGAIISNPNVAVPIIKQYGLAAQRLRPVVQILKSIGNDVNNFQVPEELKPYMKDPRAGLSIRDVTKNIHPDDIALMEKFIDSVRIPEVITLSDKEFSMIEKLAQKFGVSMDDGLAGVANKFDSILSGGEKVTGTKVPGSIAPEPTLEEEFATAFNNLSPAKQALLKNLLEEGMTSQ